MTAVIIRVIHTLAQRPRAILFLDHAIRVNNIKAAVYLDVIQESAILTSTLSNQADHTQIPFPVLFTLLVPAPYTPIFYFHAISIRD